MKNSIHSLSVNEIKLVSGGHGLHIWGEIHVHDVIIATTIAVATGAALYAVHPVLGIGFYATVGGIMYYFWPETHSESTEKDHQ